MSLDTSKCELSMFTNKKLEHNIVEASASPKSGEDSSTSELCPDLSDQMNEAVDEALLEALHAKALKIKV